MDKVEIHKMPLGPYGTNSYLLVCKATSDGVLIDPADEPEKILKVSQQVKIVNILITHNHFDHIQALPAVKKALNVPVGIHELDAGKISPIPDFYLKDGDVIKFGDCSLRCLFTPGHTAGSTAFYTAGNLIAGDTLFPGGPGKTANPAAFRDIVRSITDKIFSLPDETFVYPGHGEGTTVKQAKEEYANFNQRRHSPDLCGDVLWLSS